jgi:hypothetical protein
MCEQGLACQLTLEFTPQPYTWCMLISTLNASDPGCSTSSCSKKSALQLRQHQQRCVFPHRSSNATGTKSHCWCWVLKPRACTRANLPVPDNGSTLLSSCHTHPTPCSQECGPPARDTIVSSPCMLAVYHSAVKLLVCSQLTLQVTAHRTLDVAGGVRILPRRSGSVAIACIHPMSAHTRQQFRKGICRIAEVRMAYEPKPCDIGWNCKESHVIASHTICRPPCICKDHRMQ